MALEPWRNAATQPWSRVVWPSPDGVDGAAARATLPAWGASGVGPFVWDATSAIRVPSVARATSLYSGLIKTCQLDAYRGTDPLTRPRLLDAPDPDESRSWFVGVQIEDYLWHGNAVCLVTSRHADGWPASVVWVPAAWLAIAWVPGEPRHRYMLGDRTLPFDDVVHVRRGADRSMPARGVGVIEQHLATFDRAALEEDYERNSLAGSGVPSVAVIAPNPNLSQEEADDGVDRWMSKFYGPVRAPVILPYGTTITPLGWSPADSQMVEARKMTLQDVANAFNLDGYWLGAPMTGLTYRSPGPLYLTLLRTSLEPVMSDFELGWANRWLPRGQAIRFDRLQLTRDDFLTSLLALTKAVGSAVIDRDEARQYLGYGRAGVTVGSPVDTEELDTGEELTDEAD